MNVERERERVAEQQRQYRAAERNLLDAIGRSMQPSISSSSHHIIPTPNLNHAFNQIQAWVRRTEVEMRTTLSNAEQHIRKHNSLSLKMITPLIANVVFATNVYLILVYHVSIPFVEIAPLNSLKKIKLVHYVVVHSTKSIYLRT